VITPFRLTLLAAAVAVSCAAHAQQAAVPLAKDDKGDKVQQVVVKGTADAYDPRRDDTASKIVVNHDEIVKYGDTSVLDVLKRVPGVTVSGTGGRGGEIRMRGLGSGYTQVLINGERAPAGFSIDSLAPDVIERIEVLRAASAEFSTQSIAGTINIVLKKAVKSAQREVKAGYGHGHDFAGPSVNLQLSDRVGQLSYSLSANVSRAHFWREPATVEQHRDAAGDLDGLRLGQQSDASRFTAFNISPRLNWSFDDGDTLTSQTFFNINRFQNVSAARIATELGPPPAYPALDQTMSNDNRFFRQELNWVHKFASGGKLDAKLSGLYGDLANATYRTGGGNPASPALHEVILSALRERDPGAARAGMRTHLSQVIDYLLFATEERALAEARQSVASTRQRYGRSVSL